MPDTRELQMRRVGYRHPDAAALVAQVQQVYVHRYGDTDLTPLFPDEFAPPRGVFLVGYADGVPVACGGWRHRGGGDDPALRDGDVELKRMYVAEALRGRGFARCLLAALERRAVEAGGRRMVLETGWRQPEAIALYASSGYHEMPRFGVYREHPGSVCLAKALG
jgi:GNAT superfamily N-acetyltransferase